MRQFVENRPAVTAPRDPDSAARARLIEMYLPLVRRIASRFTGRGERLDDLVQVGSIGLIGAVDRRDLTRSGALTSYVALCVEGEIRRHLRDGCAVIRIPRRVQTEVLPVAAHPPLPLEPELESQTVAHHLPIEELGAARAMVALASRSLDGREREIVVMRYFCDLSQAEIGEAVGLSQVHVCRLLQGAIAKMRAELAPDDDHAAAAV